jgi:hypothetical protein
MRLLTLVALVLAACGDDDTPVTDASWTDVNWTDARLTCPDEPPAVCDFFLSCGCDTPTEKCGAAPAGPTCFLAGTGTEWALCTDETACAAGTTCTFYAGQLRCMQFCDGAHRCPDGEGCYISVVDSSAEKMGAVCGQQCSLLGQDCSFASQGCYASSQWMAFPESGICLEAGVNVQFETCAGAADCAAGYLCIAPTEGDPYCAKLCSRAGGDPACDEGFCRELAHHTETGICMH